MHIDPFEGSTKKRTALSVSELNRQVKQLLEASFLQASVEGELTSFSKPSSGHWYFTLKDSKAQIRCAMFRGQNLRVRFTPKEGDKVIVRAKVSLYEGRGDYQLIVDSMEPAGAGDLQKAFEELKAKLASEGLFDLARKKSLPSHPKTIGVVTSPTGAAVHDILSVLNRRFPQINVLLYPTQVQGEGAAAEIAKMIKLANLRDECDVIIVGRGGGSLEDLWAFNEEPVARAIADSQIPIVSAVGHEVDFTIADFVSDYRAPTPSAAAETLSPDQYELRQHIDHLMDRMFHGITRKLASEKQNIDALQSHIKHPGTRLQEHSTKLTELQTRLQQSCIRGLSSQTQRLDSIHKRLVGQSPAYRLNVAKDQLNNEASKLFSLAKYLIETKKNQLQTSAQTLDAVSPLATLSRGYSITSTNNDQIIQSTKDVAIGAPIKTKLSDGIIHSTVFKVD